MTRLLGLLSSLLLGAFGFLVFASPAHADQVAGKQIMAVGAAMAVLTGISLTSRIAAAILKVSLVVLVVGFVLLFLLTQVLHVIG